MSSLFKYPGQTAPLKIGLVDAQVRPAKPTKREKERKRRENSSRWKNFRREREGEEDRRVRERGVLLATEAISMARRPEETRGERERQWEREGERDEKEGEEMEEMDI